MDARHWLARRVGSDIRIRCMRGEQVLLECCIDDAEAGNLITQIQVARSVPPRTPAPDSRAPVPASRL